MLRPLILISFFLVVGLTGCEKSHDDKLNGLKNYVSKSEIGNPSFWLKKRLFTGDWSETVLFFGFTNNLVNCEELKGYYKKTDPDIAFRWHIGKLKLQPLIA